LDIVDQLGADIFVAAMNAETHAPRVHLTQFVPNAQAALQE
jgi:hypothetical protein